MTKEERTGGCSNPGFKEEECTRVEDRADLERFFKPGQVSSPAPEDFRKRLKEKLWNMISGQARNS